MSQEKVGSLLFRGIAIQVISSGKDALFNLQSLEDILARAKDKSSIATMSHNMKGLFEDWQHISIIGNMVLNSQWVDLANNISHKCENDKKIKMFVKRCTIELKVYEIGLDLLFSFFFPLLNCRILWLWFPPFTAPWFSIYGFLYRLNPRLSYWQVYIFSKINVLFTCRIFVSIVL